VVRRRVRETRSVRGELEDLREEGTGLDPCVWKESHLKA
jgi:hypothetical protein